MTRKPNFGQGPNKMFKVTLDAVHEVKYFLQEMSVLYTSLVEDQSY